MIEPSEDLLRLAEALVFASTDPVPNRALAPLLPEGMEAAQVFAAVRARYQGRGVELTEVAGGWQFRTAPDLAQRLKRVVQQPRRLPRAAMETLAIIAYHQPVTRPEIEEIRGAALSQATMEALLETGLIAPRGRKEVPGRPTLWGTTQAFLLQFGLRDLRDLPRREDLLVEPNQAVPTEARAANPAAGETGDGAAGDGAAEAAENPELPLEAPPQEPGHAEVSTPAVSC